VHPRPARVHGAALHERSHLLQDGLGIATVAQLHEERCRGIETMQCAGLVLIGEIAVVAWGHGHEGAENDGTCHGSIPGGRAKAPPG
jgi:hypothetical protein